MAKILELQKKDKYNKERTVGSIEIKNQTETTADLCFFGDINSESLGEWQKYYPEDKAPKDVGYMINKDEIRLRSATVKRMRSRIKYIVKAYERGEMTLQEVNATMQSYFGLIKHCTNEGLRENIINGFVLHCTDAARAKARESR